MNETIQNEPVGSGQKPSNFDHRPHLVRFTPSPAKRILSDPGDAIHKPRIVQMNRAARRRNHIYNRDLTRVTV